MTKHLFKVGDKVVPVLPRNRTANPGWNPSMTNLVGLVGTITNLDDVNSFYRVDFADGNSWLYLEKWLLPYSVHHVKVARFLKRKRKGI